jgi:uncharacterized protein (DUF2147 family)
MRIAIRCLVLALLALAWAPAASAAEPSPIGRWWMFDDETGAKSGIIEITLVHDELAGRVVMTIPKPGQPPEFICAQCDGPDKNQRILGLTILKGLKRDGDKWDGGTILDPRTGNVYGSELRIDETGKKLFMRGYLGISLLGRTQTWLRVE